MRIRRTLAPTAAPLSARDLVASGIGALASARRGERAAGELGEFLDADAVFLLSSGKAALTVVFQALRRLRNADAVAIPAYTCFSVPAAIVRAGLTPVLIDVDPETLDFEADSLQQVLAREDLLCVVPTHLFGIAADVARVRALARPGVFVVEDAAQALGVSGPNGERLGTLGDVSVVSFGRGKHVTCGSGGVIAARDQAIAQACREIYETLPAPGAVANVRAWIELVLTSMLLDPRLYWLPAGLPFLGLGQTTYSPGFTMMRASAVAQAALDRWQPRLTAANAARADVVGRLAAVIGGYASAARQPLLRFPVLTPSAHDRMALVEQAGVTGLGVSPMYPTGVHRISELRSQFAGQNFPGADALAGRLATLPTHEHVAAKDVAALHEIYTDTVAIAAPARRAFAVPSW